METIQNISLGEFEYPDPSSEEGEEGYEDISDLAKEFIDSLLVQSSKLIALYTMYRVSDRIRLCVGVGQDDITLVSCIFPHLRLWNTFSHLCNIFHFNT